MDKDLWTRPPVLQKLSLSQTISSTHGIHLTRTFMHASLLVHQWQNLRFKQKKPGSSYNRKRCVDGWCPRWHRKSSEYSSFVREESKQMPIITLTLRLHVSSIWNESSSIMKRSFVFLKFSFIHYFVKPRQATFIPLWHFLRLVSDIQESVPRKRQRMLLNSSAHS